MRGGHASAPDPLSARCHRPLSEVSQWAKQAASNDTEQLSLFTTHLFLALRRRIDEQPRRDAARGGPTEASAERRQVPRFVYDASLSHHTVALARTRRSLAVLSLLLLSHFSAVSLLLLSLMRLSTLWLLIMAHVFGPWPTIMALYSRVCVLTTVNSFHRVPRGTRRNSCPLFTAGKLNTISLSLLSLYLLFLDWKHPSSIESQQRYKSSTASCRDEQCATLHRIASISSSSESNESSESSESNESQCECVNKSNSSSNWIWKSNTEAETETHGTDIQNKLSINACTIELERAANQINSPLPTSLTLYSNDSQWFVSRYSNSLS